MREMKDSGIEWIGEIPKHWKCCKQKYGLTLLNGRAFKESEFLEDGKYKVLRVGNLFTNPIWHYSNLMLEDNKYCQKGDLLYSWSMSYAPFIWSGDKVIYHYHIWKVLIDDILCKKFVYYYLLALTEALYAEIHETTMGFITMGIMNNSYLPYCNLEEQQQIANFLDTQCTEIDATAEDIQKEISLLEEYKKSVITEAVTKGLNPDAEMKDSGIEWIGEIPKDWKVVRLEFLSWVRARLGWKGLKADEYVDEGYPFLSAFNIQDSKIKWEPLNFITKERFDESPEIMLACGDVLLLKDGAGVGKCARIDSLPKGDSTVNSSLAVITCFDNLNYRYLYYSFNSSFFSNLINLKLNGMGVPHLTQEELRKFIVLLPCVKEQQQIADYLDTKCSEIDTLIADKKRQLDILADYKKSLIYEYVTGKKEVPVKDF